MRHLLSINDLSKTEAIEILDTATELSRLSEGAVKKFPTLRGRTVVNLFFLKTPLAHVSLLKLQQNDSQPM